MQPLAMMIPACIAFRIMGMLREVLQKCCTLSEASILKITTVAADF